MPNTYTALLVVSQERQSEISKHLLSFNARILTATSCREAASVLAAHPDVQVVLTELSLPDGSWRDLMLVIKELGLRSEVLVSCRLGDERLWSHVLELGAFDVLVEPYQPREVTRIFNAAFSANRLLLKAAG